MRLWKLPIAKPEMDLHPTLFSKSTTNTRPTEERNKANRRTGSIGEGGGNR